MKQKQEKLQQLRQKLLHLLETHPDSPEAATWKQMLAEIGALNQGLYPQNGSNNFHSIW